MSYSERDIVANRALYNYYARSAFPDGLDQQEKYGNFGEFLRLAELSGTPFTGASVVDIGSGTGDLAGFLGEQGVEDYVGIDIYSPSVLEARKKFPTHTFIEDDFLAYDFQRTFTYALCSGALTTKLHTDNYHMFAQAVGKMVSLAQVGVSFNYLTEKFSDEESPYHFVYDFEKTAGIINQVSRGAHMQVSKRRVGNHIPYTQATVYLIK